MACLSTSMFDDWPCSYCSFYLHCQLAPCDGYNPPQLPALSRSVFIAIIGFSWWVVNVCQETHVSLVLPHHSCQVTPWPLLECHHVSISVSWVLRFLACPSSVPLQEIFSGPYRQTGQGRKRSWPCTVYSQIFLPPL